MNQFVNRKSIFLKLHKDFLCDFNQIFLRRNCRGYFLQPIRVREESCQADNGTNLEPDLTRQDGLSQQVKKNEVSKWIKT